MLKPCNGAGRSAIGTSTFFTRGRRRAFPRPIDVSAAARSGTGRGEADRSKSSVSPGIHAAGRTFASEQDQVAHEREHQERRERAGGDQAGEGQALVERSVTRTARGQGERKQRGRGHDQRQDGHEQGDVARQRGQEPRRDVGVKEDVEEKEPGHREGATSPQDASGARQYKGPSISSYANCARQSPTIWSITFAVRAPDSPVLGHRPTPFSSSTIDWIIGWWTCSGSGTGTSSIVSPRHNRIGTGAEIENRRRPVDPTSSVYSTSASVE
jgi:hypothetical protein